MFHQGDSIAVSLGEEFVVALPATPSTGYPWTAARNPDVTFVSTHQVAGGPEPGAAGTQELTFVGWQPGDSQLVLTDARRFEPGAPPANTANFPLRVSK